MFIKKGEAEEVFFTLDKNTFSITVEIMLLNLIC